MAKRWYVVHVYSGYEQRVIQYLEKAIQEAAKKDTTIETKFGEIMVPTESVFQMRASGQKTQTKRKFFPSYVFVNMELDEQTYALVRALPKVTGFLGGDKPTPVPENQAAALLAQMQKGEDRPRPKVLFEVGEMVRVTDGPFADFSGVVEEVNYEKNRLRVAVLIFGRSTPVELEFNQVEKEG